MKSARKRLSRPKAADRRPKRIELRTPVAAHDGHPDKARISAAAAAAWESRLCELELRLPQLEAENLRLREACEQLEDAAADLAKLQDIAPVGIVTFDRQGTILAINQTGAALLGHEKKKLLGRRMGTLVTAGDASKLVRHLRACQRASAEFFRLQNARRLYSRSKLPQPPASRAPVSTELALRGARGGQILVLLASVPGRDRRSGAALFETTLINLTERKQAEEALRASEKNLRALIEASPHPIQFKDADARWQLANRAALELFDLGGVDYHNKTNSELGAYARFYRDVLQERERKERAVIQAGRTSRADEIIPQPDGSARVLDIIRVPLPPADGRKKGLVVLGYDITERELAEEALRSKEAELRLITDISPIMLTRCSRDLRYLFVNRAYAEMLRLTPEQIVGRSIPEILGAEAFETIRPNIERVLEGQPVEFEVEVPYPTGLRFMHVAYVPDEDRRGNVRGWVAAISDISERRQAEEALRQSETRFRTLASHAPVGIFMADTNGDSVYVNETWCEIAGITSDQAQGREWLKAVHPADRERIESGWNVAVSGRDPSSAEFRFVHPDGDVRWVYGKAVKLCDATGVLTGYIGTVADITTRKEAERRLAANLAVARILTESVALSEATPRILQTICETLNWDVGDLWIPDGAELIRSAPLAETVTNATGSAGILAGEEPPQTAGTDAGAPGHEKQPGAPGEGNGALRCLTVWRNPAASVGDFVSASETTKFTRGIGLPGRVWESLEPVWIPDVTQDKNFPRAHAAALAGLHTGFGFPILSGEEFFGMMEFFSRETRETNDALLQMFTGIGSQIGQFIERTRAEEALRKAKDELATMNESLEKRVQERTAQLTHANEAFHGEIAERKRSELARARLVGIVESAADAILTKTLRGTITSWNKAAERMFGYTSEEIVGRPVATIIPPDRKDELAELVATLEGGEAAAAIETVRQRKDGRLIEVSLTLSPIKDETGRVRAVSAIMRDITDRKRAEAALRESETRLQAIMDNSPALIFLKDTQGRYLHFNRQFAEAFHLRLENTIGKTDAEIFPAKQAEAFRANDLTVLKAGVPTVFDEVAMHDDGPHTSIVSKSPLFDAEGKIYALVGIVTDITERKRLEEEILHISEREHRRIAQDLHDGLGQQLAGISCLSNVLTKNLADAKSPEAATATRISKLLDSAVAQSRGLARGLHPVEPDPTGLMSALEELAASVTELFKVSCTFECLQPVFVADNTMATHLYRIAQEGVTNALKHGRARKIKIGLSETPERIVLAVGDDGVGFKKTRRKKKGLGMRIMSYRAGMIGGTLVLQKKANGGTDLICTVENTNRPKRLDKDGETTAKAKRKKKDFHRG